MTKILFLTIFQVQIKIFASMGYFRGFKDLLGLKEVDRDFISTILDQASIFLEVLDRPNKKLPTLRGKTVVHMFFEPSTRTLSSFDLAAKRLSADTISVGTRGTSVVKGESLIDTMRNVDAMKVDLYIVRHSAPGMPHLLARHTKATVINAGDGTNEHPTQALLDMLTMRQIFGTLENIKILIIGDILHSRVARSNIFGLSKFGAKIYLAGPPTLVPKEYENLGAEIVSNIDDVLDEIDVVMALRIQKERLEEPYFPSIREYRKFFAITQERLKRLKPETVLMHPGPVNWGIELDYEAKDRVQNVILRQVTNGVAIRMAILYLFLVGAQNE